MQSNENDIWITVLVSAGTILTALGIGKIIPAIITWHQEKRNLKEDGKAATQKQVQELRDLISKLESKLDQKERFEIQTRATVNAMLPLMKELMKDHPDYVRLLTSLERNIMGNEMISAQGEKDKKYA